jgi:hypothetical protein
LFSSVFGRFFDVVDDEDFDRAFVGRDFEAELILYGGED